MKKIFLLLFMLPTVAFAITPGTKIFKDRNAFYQEMETIAKDYEYIMVRHEDHSMLDIKGKNVYAMKQTSLGPSYVYVENENHSVIFIFSNDGKIFNDPDTYYAATWKRWYNYYIAMGKKALSPSMICLDIDEPEYQLMKKMIKGNNLKKF